MADVLEHDLPTEHDILKILNEKSLTRNKEMNARCTAWWLANDMVRENEIIQANFSPEQVKNLSAFTNILDERVSDQRIMKAEIFRELGRFQEAIKLLQYAFKERYYSESARFIRKLAILRDNRVCKIKIEEKT